MSYGGRIKEHIGLQSRLFNRHFILFIKKICKNQVSLNNFDKYTMMIIIYNCYLLFNYKIMSKLVDCSPLPLINCINTIITS
jgi:hypothetical protein